MSKKKKFAGKKTKLATHALTQALKQVQSEGPPSSSTPAPVGTLAQALQSLRHDQLPLHLPLPEDRLPADPPPLAVTHQFLAVLKELEDIREVLRAPGVPPRPRRLGPSPGSQIAPDIITYSFRLIGHTLREIRALMA